MTTITILNNDVFWRRPVLFEAKKMAMATTTSAKASNKQVSNVDCGDKPRHKLNGILVDTLLSYIIRHTSRPTTQLTQSTVCQVAAQPSTDCHVLCSFSFYIQRKISPSLSNHLPSGLYRALTTYVCVPACWYVSGINLFY